MSPSWEQINRACNIRKTKAGLEADRSGAQFDALHAKGIRPTTFFCAHGGMALTVVSELLSRGLSIPSDASVIGFGDYSAAGHDFGAAAVRLLNARIRKQSFPDFPMRVLIPNTPIERGSVAKCPDVLMRSPREISVIPE